MATSKLALGALLGALIAVAPGLESRAHHLDASTSGAPSAVVLRASAPLSVGKGHGDASFRAHLSGRTWHVALAWSSERGHVQLGAMIAGQPDS